MPPTKRARINSFNPNNSMRVRGARKKNRKFTPKNYYPIYAKEFFPRIAKAELVLDLATSLQVGPTASEQSLSFYTNVLTSFDYLNIFAFGVQKPHAVNYLLADGGPYRRYRVVSWITDVTIVNDSSYNLDIWSSQGEFGTDMDAFGEAVKAPNSIHKSLGKAGSDSATCKLRLTGNGSAMTPDIVDGSYEFGTATSIPTQRSYLNMYLRQAAINIRYFIQMKHTYRVEFFDRYMPA